MGHNDMNTTLKTLFYTGLAALACRAVRYFNAKLLVAEAREVKQLPDAKKQYVRAIQRWEGEGGKTLTRRHGGSIKREPRGSA